MPSCNATKMNIALTGNGKPGRIITNESGNKSAVRSRVSARGSRRRFGNSRKVETTYLTPWFFGMTRKSVRLNRDDDQAIGEIPRRTSALLGWLLAAWLGFDRCRLLEACQGFSTSLVFPSFDCVQALPEPGLLGPGPVLAVI